MVQKILYHLWIALWNMATKFLRIIYGFGNLPITFSTLCTSAFLSVGWLSYVVFSITFSILTKNCLRSVIFSWIKSLQDVISLKAIFFQKQSFLRVHILRQISKRGMDKTFFIFQKCICFFKSSFLCQYSLFWKRCFWKKCL